MSNFQASCWTGDMLKKVSRSGFHQLEENQRDAVYPPGYSAD